MTNDREQGPLGAHTRGPVGEADPAEIDVADGSTGSENSGATSDIQQLKSMTKDDLAASLAELQEAMTPDLEQFELLDEDLNPVGDLEKIANITAVERRGPGRPKGASNRRNAEVFDYLEALGYRCPAQMLMAVQSSDTLALCEALGISGAKNVLGTLKLQVAAASKLIEFKYARKPTEVAVKADGEGSGRPVLLVNGSNVQVNVGDSDGGLSVGQPRKIRK